MKCTLKARLDADECQKVDAACVRETARRGKIINRTDLLRAWIAAGCPVQPEVFAGPVTLRPGPQTAPAWGWRKMAQGETIDRGDEFLVREGNAGRWIEARNRVGTQVAPLEDFRRPQHTPPKSALHMQAQHAERAEWPDVMGTGGGAAPGEKAVVEVPDVGGAFPYRDLVHNEKVEAGDQVFHCGQWKAATSTIGSRINFGSTGTRHCPHRRPVSEKLHAPEPPAASV